MKKIIFALIILVPLFASDIRIEDPGPLGFRRVSEFASGEAPADSIRALYRSEGYLDAEVEVEDSAGTLVISVKPGPRAKISEINISAPSGDYSPRFLTVGDIFRPSDLKSEILLIVDSLADAGYPFASVKVETLEIGPAAGDSLPVNISLVVTPGDSVALEAIILPDGIATKERVIRRTMLLDFPELYSESRIAKGLARLAKLPYLTPVGEPEIVLDESGVWALRLRIREEKTVFISGFAGYAPGREGESGLSGRAEGKFYNLWGTGRNLSLLWDRAAGSSYRINLSLLEPWIFGGPGSASLDFDYYSRDSSYSEREISAEYRLPISFSSSLILGAGGRSVLPDSAGQYGMGIPRSTEYNLQLGIATERLTPRVNPVRGVDFELSLLPTYIERSGPDSVLSGLAEYESMLRAEGDLSAASRLGSILVLHASVHGRSALSDGPLPESERYYLGGWNTLRGYREEQFSAEHVGWGNLEFRLLLGGEDHAFGFADGGLIRPAGGSESWKLGYGAGIRISTGIGRWSVAYGVAGGESLTAGYIHVALEAGL